ncbi:myosin light chain 5 isoform X1 [Phyllostomus discolor]|uniref:Myosin light chain 5 isoform X1 n=1 Tax=Phyllostomus discolor TaxID=89673 RepID=A0A7E6D386_9CHIR|nr:myosin light chain 5 isoform X1 [Phyllostomus discolor]
MDQNRDGFIDKEDLKDTYASLGKINVKDDELDAMLKEATGPINFTMFLNMFGEKLSGTDTEETILNAFKMLDPDGKGSINKDYIKRLLMSQADKMTAEEVWPFAPPAAPSHGPPGLQGSAGGVPLLRCAAVLLRDGSPCGWPQPAPCPGVTSPLPQTWQQGQSQLELRACHSPSGCNP